MNLLAKYMCVSLLMLGMLAGPAWASNTHGLGSNQREMQAFFGEALPGYIATGCLPVVPASSLTIASFACTGYGVSASELIYISETAAITIADATTTWLAIHRDQRTAVAGWTRQTGTHYLYQSSATQPPDPPGGVVFARVTVAGSVITAITPLAYRSPLDAAHRRHSVLSWGAVADNTTDDLPAFNQANAAAAISGVPVWIPKTPLAYRLDGEWTVTTSVRSNGALLMPHANVVQADAVDLIIMSAPAIDPVIEGLRIDCENKCIGIQNNAVANVTVQNNVILNTQDGGIRFFDCDGGVIFQNRIEDVRYRPSVGVGADPIYVAGCTGTRITHNDIEDFRRIGITAEDNGGNNSRDLVISHNYIRNGNNHDDQFGGTETNAGIWVEDTESAVISHNVISDMANNAGQTLTPYGVTVGFVDSSRNQPETFWVTHNVIVLGDDLNTQGGNGVFLAGGTTGFSDENTAYVVKNSIYYGTRGVIIQNPFNKIVIEDNDLYGMLFSSATAGGVVLDGANTAIVKLVIENLQFINTDDAGGNADWGHLVILSPVLSITKLVLENLDDFTPVMRGSQVVGEIRVDNSTISVGNTGSFPALDGDKVFISSSIIKERGHPGFLTGTNSTGDRLLQISDTELIGLTDIINEDDGNTFRIFFDDVTALTGNRINLQAAGVGSTMRFRLEDSYIEEWDATDGFIFANGGDAAGVLKLYVHDVYFRHTNSAATPLKQSTVAPDCLTIHDTIYTTTALDTFNMAAANEDLQDNWQEP